MNQHLQWRYRKKGKHTRIQFTLQDDSVFARGYFIWHTETEAVYSRNTPEIRVNPYSQYTIKIFMQGDRTAHNSRWENLNGVSVWEINRILYTMLAEKGLL